MPNRTQLVLSRIYFLLAIIVLWILLYELAPILQPFLIGALIAYLANPLVDYLKRFKIPRLLAVFIVFFLMMLLVILLGFSLVPLVIEQVNQLLRKLPIILMWFQTTALPWVNAKLGNLPSFNTENLNFAVMEAIKTHQDVIGKVLATLTSSGFTIIAFVFQMLLIPIVTFYLLRDWDKLVTNIRKILPRSIEPTVVLLVKRYNAVLKSFIRGQLLVMILLSMIYTLGLWGLGLQFALLIGMVAGLLSIVPYLGFTVGLFTAMFAAYYQFHSFSFLLYVLLVFGIGQGIESMLLTPLLVGDSIGLHPVAVIFSVLAGGYLLGFLGALIALPVAAAIMVLIRYGLSKYYSSSLYTL